MPTAAVIDSQTVRAADSVPTASSGHDGGKKIKGRKRHVAVDTGGLLLAVVVTTASLQNRDGAFRITAALREAFSTITPVWAEAGYTGRFVRDARKIWDLAVAIATATGRDTESVTTAGPLRCVSRLRPRRRRERPSSPRR